MLGLEEGQFWIVDNNLEMFMIILRESMSLLSLWPHLIKSRLLSEVSGVCFYCGVFENSLGLLMTVCVGKACVYFKNIFSF